MNTAYLFYGVTIIDRGMGIVPKGAPSFDADADEAWLKEMVAEFDGVKVDYHGDACDPVWYIYTKRIKSSPEDGAVNAHIFEGVPNRASVILYDACRKISGGQKLERGLRWYLASKS